MKNALAMTHEITNLVKYSPRREADLKGDMAPGLEFCVPLGGQ